MDTFWQDIRYGLRMMRQSPGVTILAIVALGLGIGVNSSIFSLVNAVLLRPLPYHDPGQLVQPRRVQARAPEGPTIFGQGEMLGGPEFLEWKENSKTLSHVAAFSGDGVNLTGGDRAERIQASSVTADFFPLLGIQPFLGRGFQITDDQPESEPVVLLTHALWTRRFSASLDILGKTIQIDGKSATVIGVLPPTFHFREPFELYQPFRLDPVTERAGQRMTLLEILGRLKPGVTMEQARSELDTLATRLSERAQKSPGPAGPGGPRGGGRMIVREFRGPPPGGGPPPPFDGPDVQRPMPAPERIELIGWHEQLVGNVKPALMMLVAAVGFVLLIACANVANLLLARASARQKEIAIRTALGAARFRIIRQLLTESIMLSISGAALGLLLAYWSIDVARAYATAHLATLHPIAIDGWVLAFTATVALATGILFGLAPALQSARVDVSEPLKEGSRTGGASRARNGFRNALIILESALAIILLAGAGLLLRSFLELRGAQRGFQPEGVLTASVILTRENYPKAEQQRAFVQQLLERLRALPGVEAAGAADHIPLTDYSMLLMTTIEGHQGAASFVSATPEFFPALKIELRDGRFFENRDTAEATTVAIVNEAFVQKFFEGKSPVGKRLPIFDKEATIVGVVGNISSRNLESQAPPEVYRPYAQTPNNRFRLTIRAQGDLSAVATAVRGAVHAIDPNQPVYQIMTMEERLSGAFAPRRLNLILLGIFASLALLLSAVGIYGVMSYVVSQCSHEIGVRMALGAQRSDILGLIINQGMLLVGSGVAVGLIIALVMTKSLRAMLYGIEPQDPVTFIVVPASLLIVAFVACWFPARRATQADPINALRCE